MKATSSFWALFFVFLSSSLHPVAKLSGCLCGKECCHDGGGRLSKALTSWSESTLEAQVAVGPPSTSAWDRPEPLIVRVLPHTSLFLPKKAK